MKYLHAMVRVRDVEASLRFFRDGLGLAETRRMRTISHEGTSRVIVSAIVTSSALGTPKLSPSRIVRATASST